jgi:hypothetical protein
MAMRLHITLREEVVADLDRRVGKRRRSAFISTAVTRALDDQQRWDEIEAALGSIPDSDHDWDNDPAAWVRAQRRGDRQRVG